MTINYRRVNDDPTANDDTGIVVAEDFTPYIDIDVLANDNVGPANEGVSGEGQTLSITGVSPIPISKGTVTVLTVAGTPVIRFTPAANFNGPVSFTYTITDNGQTWNDTLDILEDDFKSDTGAVSITVTPVNDSPDDRRTGRCECAGERLGRYRAVYGR